MIRRTIINRRNRRNIDSGIPGNPNDAAVTAVGIATVTVTLTLNAPCSLSGVPQVLSVGANGSLPVSASMTDPSHVALVYALTQAASTDFIVPNQDPALRTYTGGYVAAGTFQP